VERPIKSERSSKTLALNSVQDAKTLNAIPRSVASYLVHLWNWEGESAPLVDRVHVLPRLSVYIRAPELRRQIEVVEEIGDRAAPKDLVIPGEESTVSR
jgi:hypothetical protein